MLCFWKKPALAVLIKQENDGVSMVATFPPNGFLVLDVIIRILIFFTVALGELTAPASEDGGIETAP